MINFFVFFCVSVSIVFFLQLLFILLFFFFSSRRRHTRLVSDWSSDVCSSDLPRGARGLDEVRVAARRAALAHVSGPEAQLALRAELRGRHACGLLHPAARVRPVPRGARLLDRSEERRVGKEARCRWARGAREQ